MPEILDSPYFFPSRPKYRTHDIQTHMKFLKLSRANVFIAFELSILTNGFVILVYVNASFKKTKKCLIPYHVYIVNCIPRK